MMRFFYVLPKMTGFVAKSFQDQYYAPLAGNISRKERKQRIKEFGHLNLSKA